MQNNDRSIHNPVSDRNVRHQGIRRAREGGDATISEEQGARQGYSGRGSIEDEARELETRDERDESSR